MVAFKYSRVDFLFTCLGLFFLLLDIALDIWAAVSFYQEKAYVCLGILLVLLLGSSVLVQVFSWLWYSYEDFKMETKVEKSLSPGQLKFLHVLQLGIYFRHAGVVEMSVRSFLSRVNDPEGFAVYLSHDLSMLRLIETFSESAPQLVLMLTIILQRAQLDPVTVLKAVGSASAIAYSVTTYHRNLRSFLPDKEKQQVFSSLIYFLWNLFLIAARLTSLALFASVLPCFIFTHFICSWLVLFFCAWRSKTDFMDSPCGEWIYRATVGLIWYFNWFNVVDGRTRNRTTLYHVYILVDIVLLCGLWCWKTMPEQPYYQMSDIYRIIAAVCVVSVYIFGLIFKITYYTCNHPNLDKEQLEGGTTEKLQTGLGPCRKMTSSKDSIDGLKEDVEDRSGPSAPAPVGTRCNKRMRNLASNFYT